MEQGHGSNVQTLHKLTECYHRAGKTGQLRHLSPNCRHLLGKADSIIEVNIMEDPLYPVAGANIM